MAAVGSRAAVIFLHGLGDAGASWSWMARRYGKALGGNATSFAFPDAPLSAVTLAPGSLMPSWFDLDDLPVTAATPDDLDGLTASTARIHRMIDEEVARGTHPLRIVLGGFSQGAALSLYAGLRYAQPLGGIILLSGWTAAKAEMPGCMSPAVAAAKPRVYAAHGVRDDKVLYELGKGTVDLLKANGFDVTWRPFEGYHELAEDSVGDMAAFLRDVLLKAP